MGEESGDPARGVARRFAGEPGRSLESHLRFYAHRWPRGVWAACFAAFLAVWAGLGALPGCLVFLAYWHLRSRAYRPFDLLAEERGLEAEAAALEDLAGELPGPVADEYLTVAAIGRAMAGDGPGARELLARRQAPVRELAALAPGLHRPLGAAALEAAGEPAAALDVLGQLDPDRDAEELVAMRAGLLASARGYDEARLVLARLRSRPLAEATARTASAIQVAVARETWDEDLELALDELAPRDSGEEAVALSARAFLGEVKGHKEEAHAFGRRLFELRLAEAGLEASPALHRLRDGLEATLLGLDRLEPDALDAALARHRREAAGLGPGERDVLEVLWLEAMLRMAAGWLRKDDRAAALAEVPARVLDAAGAFLRAARALWRLEQGRLDEASEAARQALAVGRDAPPGRVADALVRHARGLELSDAHRVALAGARFALRVYPAPLRPMLEDRLARAGG